MMMFFRMKQDCTYVNGYSAAPKRRVLSVVWNLPLRRSRS